MPDNSNGAVGQTAPQPAPPIYQFPIIDANAGVDLGTAAMLVGAGVDPRTAQIVEFRCRQIVSSACTQVLNEVMVAVQRAQVAKYEHISRIIGSMPHMGAVGWMPQGVREALMMLGDFGQAPPIISPTDGAMIFPQRPQPQPVPNGAPPA